MFITYPGFLTTFHIIHTAYICNIFCGLSIYLHPPIAIHLSNLLLYQSLFLAFSIPRSRTVVARLPQSIPIPIYQPYPPTIGLLIKNYLFLQSTRGGGMCGGEAGRGGRGEAYYHKPNLKHYKLYIRFYMVSNPVKKYSDDHNCCYWPLLPFQKLVCIRRRHRHLCLPGTIPMNPLDLKKIGALGWISWQ